jgi:hypothetical protein
MQPIHFSVDVLMERVPLVNRWASEKWQPKSIIPIRAGDAMRQAPQCLADGPDGTVWRFPGFMVELHVTEAEGYYLNLTSETPLVFVMWRQAEGDAAMESGPAVFPEIVTVSYNQAGRYMDGGEKVDPVPMPDVIRAWMAPFVAENYKPEPKRKVKRNDPFKDGAFVRDRERRS